LAERVGGPPLFLNYEPLYGPRLLKRRKKMQLKGTTPFVNRY
jgi:hypothetical protein